MRRREFAWLLALAFPLLAQGHPNVLTKAEHESGWTSLFDGSAFAIGTLSKTPDRPWRVIEDGWIRSEAFGGGARTSSDSGTRLRTLEANRDFDLRFDFKIAKEGNSGVKYRPRGFWSGLDRAGRTPGAVERLGLEYQVQAGSLPRIEVAESPIDLTHHDSGVWFRNIKIRRLP